MVSSVLFVGSLLLGFTHAQFSGTYGMTETVSNVSSSDCPTGQGAHIIVARASYEPLGYGIIGLVKDQVLKEVPGSTAEFVIYPAVINPNYIESESTGVVVAQQLISNFVAKCQGSPLVVMGYSQGAQVTTDSLAGQDLAGFPDNTTIDQPPPASTLERVAAAVMMGDPAHTLNQTFSVGNADKNGIFPRKNNANFDTTGLASRMKSYCNAGDPYCAAGGNLTVHLIYVQEFGQQATDFIVAQIKDWYSNNTSGSSGNSTGAPSATSTPTPYTGSASSLSISSIVPVALLGLALAMAL